MEHGLGIMTIATGTSMGWNCWKATGTGDMGMAPMGPMGPMGAPIGPMGYTMGGAKVTVGMVMAEIAAESSTCTIFVGSKQPEMATGRKAKHSIVARPLLKAS